MRTKGGEATASWGQNRTDFEPTGHSVNDGDTLFASLNGGFGIGGGFLNLTAEYRDRDRRCDRDRDQIPFFEEQTPANLALAGTQTHKAGDGTMEDLSFMFNAAVPLGESFEFYSFGGYSQRDGEGANFFRYPDSFANVPTIFPDGYIPVLEADNVDMSLAAGWRGSIAFGLDLGPVRGLRLERLRPRRHQFAQRVARRREPDELQCRRVRVHPADVPLRHVAAVRSGRLRQCGQPGLGPGVPDRHLRDEGGRSGIVRGGPRDRRADRHAGRVGPEAGGDRGRRPRCDGRVPGPRVRHHGPVPGGHCGPVRGLQRLRQARWTARFRGVSN